MANSLKDALMQAGLVDKDQPERDKEKKRRENIQKKGPEQTGIHTHHIRTDCDQCKNCSPDVEFYEHRNRQLTAKWLCVECADKFSISDDFRQTKQSSHAKSGMFRRFYGHTKRF